MKRRDFYKEIMSEYSFDKDKILANAKKGKFAGRKNLPMYIGLTAAAAAVVVAVGTASVMLNSRQGAQYIGGTTLTALSNEERIQKAMEEIRRNENSDELHDVLVTFTRPLAPSQVQSVLTQYSDGNVPVKILYMADGSKAVGSEAVGEAFSNGRDSITGAVINCAGYLMSKIKSSEFVFEVEIVTDEDIASDVAPMKPEVENNDKNDTTSDGNTSVPALPDGNSGGVGVGFDNTSDLDGDVSDGEESDPDDPENSESSDGSESSESSEDSEDPDSSDIPDGSEESGSVPVHPMLDPLDGIKLPTDNGAMSYNTANIGAQRAYFLNENVFYVKSADAVSLYTWDGSHETLAAQQEVSDAKVFWVSKNGSKMMITGVENGVRSKMYMIDGANCAIIDMCAENMVLSGSIANAAYSEASGLLAADIFEDGTHYIYTAAVSDNRTANELCVAGGTNTQLLAQDRGTLFYTDYYNGITEIYKLVNGDYVKITELSDYYTSAPNSAFTYAVLSGNSDRYIFDPATQTLIPVQSENAPVFGASTRSFSLDGEHYTILNGAINSGATLSEIARIDFRRSFSQRYIATANEGAVRIIPGCYTSAAKSSAIFAEPVSNASEKAQTAVNSALGVINALALNKCNDSGITSAEKLNAVIDAYFSKQAAAELKTRCTVSAWGGLAYTNGGLSAVNVQDTVLVMDGLSGTLYIKAGTFDGKTAYFTHEIRLVEENGNLKLDCILG